MRSLILDSDTLRSTALQICRTAWTRSTLDLGAQSRWPDRGLWYAQCHTVARPADVPSASTFILQFIVHGTWQKWPVATVSKLFCTGLRSTLANRCLSILYRGRCSKRHDARNVVGRNVLADGQFGLIITTRAMLSMQCTP